MYARELARWTLCAVALPASIGAAAPPPRRVVSLNLCADQYLLALADRAQIAGVTRLAREPAMSAAAREAATVPTAATGAEALLAEAPDLVLAGWAGQADAALRLGLKAQVVVVPPANSYDDIRAQARAVAAALGHPARGEALVRRMDAALARVPRTGRGRVAADYQRRGFLGGPATLVDEMMRRVGLVNLATRLGRPALSRLSLEEIVAAQPDLLVGGTGTAADLGSAMLRHPAIAAIPRARLPGALLDCGGPAYPRAVTLLAHEVAKLPARH